MFYCFLCGHKLIWQSDFTFEEYGYIGDGIVGVYTCSNSEKCNTEFELKTPLDSYLDDELSDIYSNGSIDYFTTY